MNNPVTIAPKEKYLLDIKLVQECMDAHAKRIAIAYANYLQEHAWEKFGDTWCQPDERCSLSDEVLYNKFIESITTES